MNRVVRTLLLGLTLGGALLTGVGLEAQITVSGTVTRNGVGLPGADLDLASGGVNYSLSGDLTGVGGAFSFTILQGPTDPIYSPGSYTLEINPPPGSLAITPSVNLTVSAAGGNQNVGNFAVTAGYVISGTIVDSFGVGVGGLDIDVQPDSGGDPTPLQSGDSTDASGNFAVTIEQISNDYFLQFFPPAPVPAPTTCMGAGQTPFPTPNPNCAFGVLPLTTLPQFIFGDVNLGTLTMPNAACLSATIVDTNGVPIPGIDTQVTVVSTNLNAPLNDDDSDCMGQVKVLVPLGEIDILFRDPVPEMGGPIDYAPVFLPNFLVTGATDLGTIVMGLGRNVSGTVLRESGAPVAGAEVEFFDSLTGALTPQSNDATNGAGAFTYFVADGSYVVEIDPPLALEATVVTRRVPVTVAGANLTMPPVTLPDGFRISGQIVDDAIPANPVPSVDVEFEITATGAPYEAFKENGNAAGNFAATIEPNTYDVFFYPPLGSGRAPAVSPAASVLTAALNLGTVVLGPGVSFMGEVSSASTPVEDAIVTLSGAINYDNVTGPTGLYGYQVPTGTYDVTVTPPLGSLDPPLTILGVTIAADTVLDFDLQAAPDPITNPVCSGGLTDVTLNWTIGPIVAETIEVARGGVVIATLPGTATSYSDPGLAAGTYDYSLTAVRSGVSATPALCTAFVGQVSFIRGDANQNGSVNLADAIFSLAYLFQGQQASCLDALDTNDNGAVNIADVIALLSYLFSGGPEPQAPFPTPGADPTVDPIGCQ